VSADTTANGQTPVLELKGLSKSFGGLHAVRGVTFKIMPGDRKAIIGPNGAGKTTLFNLITGFFRRAPDRCCCSATTSRPGKATPHRARHGADVSDHEPVPALTVLDNVLLAIKGCGRRSS
jgi:branched-chain amino acid transport system ATP-binding protein